MNQLFSEIQKKGYANLILDARGRKNISLKSALFLADHLISQTKFWGSYVTKLGIGPIALMHTPSDFEKFIPYLRTLSGSNDLYKESGCYLKTVPSLPAFTGKVYVLTDQRTSKVAESLTIWLKNEKIAIIVGQKSAGSPMIIQTVEIDDQYHLALPVAQFFDSQGKSYLNIGVEPDLTVANEDALGFLLKKLE